jgi:hypothetical protein
MEPKMDDQPRIVVPLDDEAPTDDGVAVAFDREPLPNERRLVTEWFSGPSIDFNQSFHPNDLGKLRVQ